MALQVALLRFAHAFTFLAKMLQTASRWELIAGSRLPGAPVFSTKLLYSESSIWCTALYGVKRTLLTKGLWALSPGTLWCQSRCSNKLKGLTGHWDRNMAQKWVFWKRHFSKLQILFCQVYQLFFFWFVSYCGLNCAQWGKNRHSNFGPLGTLLN